MKHVNRYLALFLLLVMSTLSLYTGHAEGIQIDYDSLTLDELEQIIQDANDAIAKNHAVDYSTSSALESKTKVSVVQMMPNLQREPSWRWFDWTYKRNWDKITVNTEVKIDGEWLPLEAEYNESKGEFDLKRLIVGGKVYYDAGNDTNDNSASQDEKSGKTEGSSNDNSQKPTEKQEKIIAKKGDKGEVVSEIQAMLIQLGYANGKPSGKYGDSTKKAIARFQKKNGLQATGVVTESVYSLLIDACSNLPEQVERVTAIQLYNAFNENEIAADSKYKNKVIEVTGEVNSVEKSWGTIYVDLDVNWLPMVHCAMNEDQIDAVAALKKGQKIIIRGTCTGVFLTIVSLDDCVLVD